MMTWEPMPSVHGSFVEFASQYNGKGIPVLTTNYDHLLKEAYALGAKERSIRAFGDADRRTRYLFNRRYSLSDLLEDSISNNFAIWHIHGDIENPLSIKVSSSDYAGLLANYKNGFTSEYSWLRIFKENDLVILGLSLDLSEYPLRWLLYDRMVGLRSNSVNSRTIYCDIQNKTPDGKRFYFESIGVEVMDGFDSYDEMYAQFGVAKSGKTMNKIESS
jgi:hypothetical protein